MLSAFHDAFSLLETLDSNLLEIVIVSLHVSISALVIGCVLGMPLGALVAIQNFPGRQIVIVILNSLMGVPTGQPFSLPGHAILIQKSPVLNVVSINYLDMAGVLQSMPASNYTVDTACEPARITPVFSQIWPIALPQIGAISVTFDAGYGTAVSVPEGIKSWIKLRVGSLYAHREEVAALSRGRIEPLPFVDGLLDPFKVSFI